MEFTVPRKELIFAISKRQMFRALGCGALITLMIAWACALWSPTRFTFEPFDNPTIAKETVDPDGLRGVHHVECGIGWSYACRRGERTDSGDIMWCGPYGGVYHRFYGWPFKAMRSRVEVFDSQSAGRFSEGQEPPELPPARTRWALPLAEIIARGVATKDGPRWLHARNDQRLALVPQPAEFCADTLLYAIACLIINAVSAKVWRAIYPKRRGFPVVLKAPDI
jgi:hypothetical protein